MLDVVVLVPPKRPNSGDGNVVYLNAPRVSHGVSQVVIHPQVASQATGVVNVHDADMVMY
jgi:hypothetical protein